MAKFTKKVSKDVPGINTGSMSDIIFMFLFFFMVITTIREVTLIVRVSAPKATEVQKLEKKSLVSFIYIGQPTMKKFGNESRIQLNDQFAEVNDIVDYIVVERQARDESEVPMMVTSLKIDEFTKMNIVQDIKQELRRASALHINYSARKRTENL